MRCFLHRAIMIRSMRRYFFHIFSVACTTYTVQVLSLQYRYCCNLLYFCSFRLCSICCTWYSFLLKRLKHTKHFFFLTPSPPIPPLEEGSVGVQQYGSTGTTATGTTTTTVPVLYCTAVRRPLPSSRGLREVSSSVYCCTSNV